MMIVLKELNVLNDLVRFQVGSIDDLFVLWVRNRLPDVEQLIIQDEAVHHGWDKHKND